MKNNLSKYIKHFMNNKLIIFLIYFIVFSIFLIILTIYMHSIFFRERLPRNIPFELTIFGFIILIEICCIYIYVIFVTIKPNEIITIIINNILEPLVKLDNFIKELPLIKEIIH